MGGVCAFLAVSFFLFSCTTGLGESIDLEAPVLEITSPRHGAYVPKTFTLEGTATDNKRVNRVEIEYKYKKNGETISDKKTATLSGEKWECDFSFDGEYEVEFEAYAYDALKNGSDNSHQRIMLLIDSQNPTTDTISIVRGDYVARLYPLERFTESGGITELKNDPKNKDNFQNEKITLVTTLDDNYSIGEVSLDLYEVNPETKEETIIKEGIPADSQDNKYYPNFTITEEVLPQKGLHYISPRLNVSDEAGNKVINKEGNVFAWESEYNRPHVSSVSMQSDGHIEIERYSPIIITVFDDDKLKSCNYTGSLIKEGEFSDKYSVDFSNYKFEDGSRDLSFEIDTKELELGTYYIVMKIEDSSVKNNNIREDGIYFEAIPVKITNAAAPVIVVDAPEQNTAPALINGEFTIEGRVIDNEDGLDKIAIAWLPKGNDDIPNAETLFKDYDFRADKDSSGIKIYKLDAIPTDKVSGKSTYAFSKTYNFFEDFIKADGSPHNENKVFMIAAKDPTGNLVTSTFRLSKISSAPKFRVGYNNGIDDKEPADNLTFTPLANRETTFTIRPYSDSNLKITKFSVVGSDNGKTVNESNESGDDITITFGTDEANLNKVYKYILSATDQIGGNNPGETLTIQFDQFGVLQSITCEKSNGTIFTSKEDENKIRLQANFDYKVYVNGTPYIQLSGTGFRDKNGNNVPPENRRAKYTGGSNSNTLYFEYYVPAGIECTNLAIGNITVPKDGVAVLEGNIKNPDKDFKDINEVDGKKYAIDSIAPYIKGMTPGMGGVVTKKNGATTITFQFNEPVTVESGTVIIQRTDGWYIPPVIDEEVFQKIYNEKLSDPKDKETLCGTDDLSSNDRFYKNTLIPKGPYMQYTNGIVEKNGNMVPDLTTKYVLAYQYNIGDTTNTPEGKTVAELRKVLEKAGYHRAEIDASSRMKQNGNNMTLEIDDDDFTGDLVNGVEYKILFKNFTVRDEAYNSYSPADDSELKLNGSNDSYKFWVGPVATPIIRVNRTATNGINDNPFDEGAVPDHPVDIAELKTGAAQFTRAARTTFKIDCETPGATVQYGIRKENSTPVSTDTIKKLNIDGNKEGVEYTNTIPDLSFNGFNGIQINSDPIITYGTSRAFGIGTNSNEISEKIYIKAQATKAPMDSAIGQEGAFKTVIHYYLNYQDDNNINGSVGGDWRKNNNGGDTRHGLNKIIKEGDDIKTPLLISGSQVPEGTSYTAGWPLIQSGEPRSNYQIAYTGEENTDDYKHFYWVSWQILDKFNLQTYSVNFQDPANPNVTYGMYHYCKNKRYYGWLFYNAD